MGTGNLANEVFKILQENNITRTGVFVDIPVYGQNKFKDYTIQSLQKLQQCGQKISVLMGYAQYDRILELKAYSVVQNVYYILNLFRIHEDISYEFYEHKEQYQVVFALFEEDKSQREYESFLHIFLMRRKSIIC